ncbi:MobF family relaxase [uncultured Dokdonia sp.]|uniref:MobF family relaxase n=1 Tax=uncultured Dokdonia sp. TaxID=575653 RepID=UPI00263165BA|nr:MobF family relaxase [uncultured Dokdonia sp.]
MIRIFQSKTASHAKNYFREALSQGDYYIEGQETKGVFNGKIAKRLGLEGKPIDKQSFDSLCDNLHPVTGETLTPRTLKDRRIGNDISFHCPKSVSILLGLTRNDNIRQAIDQSVFETMQEMQDNMFVRVRSKGRNEDKPTGEMLWCDFPHRTARAVKGHVPDPHYHIHCLTMNLTFSEEDNRFKAAQFYYIRKDMPYYQARFHKRLADKLDALGFNTRKTAKGFELCLVPQKAIENFSKRTNLIGQIAQENNITHPKALDKLGGITREKKDKSLNLSQLEDVWRSQLESQNLFDDDLIEKATTDNNLTASKAVKHALSHCFANSSVKRETQILAQAYIHAIDNPNVTLRAIDTTLNEKEDVFKVTADYQTYCTTESIKEEEKQMISLARSSIGKVPPLVQNFDKSTFQFLNEEQQKAISYVMRSKNRINIIKGGAGTGKTTLLKSIVPEIEQSGKQVFLFTPTAEASRGVLKSEGFEKADTLAKLLTDKKLQQKTKDQVIWIDEAGLIGTQDMVKLLELAVTLDTRIVLSGDAKQHNAVKRGDALRLLQEIGRIPYASVTSIYRQKTEDYKTAIREISEGNIVSGFEHLETMGSIQEVDVSEMNDLLVSDYLKTREQKKIALVISPTREKVRELNIQIRKGLQQRGVVSKKEHSFTIFDNCHYSLVQKQDPRTYRQGQIIQTHWNMKGIIKGSVLSIIEVRNNEIIVENGGGANFKLHLSNAKDFDIYIPRAVELSKGDEIRLNKNSTDLKGKRLNNGTTLTIGGFTTKGHIKAFTVSGKRRFEYLLDRRHGNYDLAYCTTSYSSQGKTVDKVIIAQPASTFPASDQKQFYVSTSRAREDVTIYTDDKELLLDAIKVSGNRLGAIEMAISNIVSIRKQKHSKKLE